MSGKVKEPEEVMRKKLGKLCLKESEIYDVLGYLIEKHGLGTVVGKLGNYLGDQAETAFGEVDIPADGSWFTGLSEARAWDVCACLAECLLAKAEEYKL